LGVCVDEIQWCRVHLVRSQFISPQYETYLGAVSVSDDQVPAPLDHVRDVLAGLFYRHGLRRYIFMLLVKDQ